MILQALQKTIGPAVYRGFERHYRELIAATRDPRPAQAAAFRKLQRLNGASRLGRLAGLDRTDTMEQARALPVSDYSTIKAHADVVRRFGRDARGIFGTSELIYVAQTSGTTATPKRFPITREYVRSYRRHMRLFTSALLYGSAKGALLKEGKQLVLPARPRTGRTEGGLDEGFMSGIMMMTMPGWMRLGFAPSREVLSRPSWDEKMGAVADEVRDLDIRALGALPPLALTFAEVALERTGAKTLREIWPHLSFIVSGGVSLSEQTRRRFHELAGTRDLHFSEIYAATEGHFGFTLGEEYPGMAFNPFENFYQFRDTRTGDMLHLHELREGHRYGVHVTTPGGLINYRMGDLIEPVSARPLLFRVCGREKDEISLATEKIIPEQVEKAMDRACRTLGMNVRDFVIWAEEGRPNRLIWGIVPEREGAETTLAEELDRSLRRINPSYDEMRSGDLIYGPPKAVRLPGKVFRRYRERNLDCGQFKGKRLFRSEEDYRREYLP